MIRVTVCLLIFSIMTPLLAVSQPMPILQRPVSFFIGDGELTRLEQNGDTVVEQHGNVRTGPAMLGTDKAYYIHSVQNLADYDVAIVEQLAAHPSREPMQEDRFSIWSIKRIDASRLGWTVLRAAQTQHQLDAFEVNVENLRHQFYLTYFSDSCLLEFDKMAPIATEEDRQKISDWLNRDEVMELANNYQQSNLPDPYGSAFFAEVLNRACIALGYNPVGASDALRQN